MALTTTVVMPGQQQGPSEFVSCKALAATRRKGLFFGGASTFLGERNEFDFGYLPVFLTMSQDRGAFIIPKQINVPPRAVNWKSLAMTQDLQIIKWESDDGGR